MPAVILVISTLVPALGWLALTAAVLIVLIVLGDILASVRPRQITLTRVHDPLLSIGVENVVKVSVANHAAQPLKFVVRDEAPDEFLLNRLVLKGGVEAHGASELTYRVTPFRRGEYQFGSINLRYRSALGLIERQTRTPTDDRAVVYPDILELRKYTLSIRGTDEETFNRTRFRGGTEFERLRDYTPDDEFRFIDWKATARLRRPVARQFQTERNQNILLMYDLGRHMTSPYRKLLKLDYAINSGVVLSYVGAQRNEHLGLALFQDSVCAYLPPRPGLEQFRRILNELYKAQPGLVEPDYEAAIAYISRRSSRRSLVLIFTDVVDRGGAQALLRGVSLLRPKHLPLVVLLMDPEIEAYAEQPPDDETQLYRAAVAQRLIDERRVLTRSLESHGVIVVDVPASELTVTLLDNYVRLKSRSLL